MKGYVLLYELILRTALNGHYRLVEEREHD